MLPVSPRWRTESACLSRSTLRASSKSEAMLDIVLQRLLLTNMFFSWVLASSKILFHQAPRHRVPPQRTNITLPRLGVCEHTSSRPSTSTISTWPPGRMAVWRTVLYVNTIVSSLSSPPHCTT
jgi:hypothetical protein